jgi:hypothetical protein
MNNFFARSVTLGFVFSAGERELLHLRGLTVVETLDIDKPCVLRRASVEEPARRSK